MGKMSYKKPELKVHGFMEKLTTSGSVGGPDVGYINDGRHDRAGGYCSRVRR